MAQHLIGIARPLYASEPSGIDRDATAYAFDKSITYATFNRFRPRNQAPNSSFFSEKRWDTTGLIHNIVNSKYQKLYLSQ
jgi:hypothetical protein